MGWGEGEGSPTTRRRTPQLLDRRSSTTTLCLGLDSMASANSAAPATTTTTTTTTPTTTTWGKAKGVPGNMPKPRRANPPLCPRPPRATGGPRTNPRTCCRNAVVAQVHTGQVGAGAHRVRHRLHPSIPQVVVAQVQGSESRAVPQGRGQAQQRLRGQAVAPEGGGAGRAFHSGPAPCRRRCGGGAVQWIGSRGGGSGVAQVGGGRGDSQGVRGQRRGAGRKQRPEAAVDSTGGATAGQGVGWHPLGPPTHGRHRRI
jgi:hypothetical protein